VILATVHRPRKLGRAARIDRAGFLELLGSSTRHSRCCCAATAMPHRARTPRGACWATTRRGLPDRAPGFDRWWRRPRRPLLLTDSGGRQEEPLPWASRCWCCAAPPRGA